MSTLRWRMATRVAGVLCVGGLVACGGDTTSGDDDTSATPGPELAEAGFVLAGVVTDATGAPVVGGRVVIEGYGETVTDSLGFYTFSLLEPPEDTSLVVEFDSPLGGRTEKVVEFDPTYPYVAAAAVLPIPEPPATLDAEAGGVLDFGRVRLTFPPNAFVTPEGDPVSGEVSVSVILFDPVAGTNMNALPNMVAESDESAAAAHTVPVEEDPDLVLLRTLGMVDVEITQENPLDGTRIQLDLAPGVTSTIELVGLASEQTNPLTGEPFQAGDTNPLYFLPDGKNIWTLEDREGWSAADATDGSGTLSLFAEVGHYTKWNDDVRCPDNCVQGVVTYLCAESKDREVGLPNVEVNLWGEGGSCSPWHTYTYTDRSGAYCSKASSDSDVYAIFVYTFLYTDKDGNPAATAIEERVDGSRPTTSSDISCGHPDCLPINLTLSCLSLIDDYGVDEEAAYGIERELCGMPADKEARFEASKCGQ